MGRIEGLCLVVGSSIGFDVYPYTAGSGPFEQYFDPDHVDVARLEFVQIVGKLNTGHNRIVRTWRSDHLGCHGRSAN